MEEEAGQRRIAPGLMLAVLWAVSVVVYVLLGRRHVIPSISPDEFTYGHLARSIADGEGLNWNGESVPLRAALYLYAIAPAWLVDSTTSAYGIAKVLGAALCSAVVLPTWLLARRAVGPVTALIPAGLALAGTWMLVSAGILTENLAYPLGAAALASIVVTIQRPGSRWLWASLGLLALAALSRAQLGALVAVLPLAALADAARGGRAGLRAGIARHGRTLGVGAAITLAGVVAALVSPSTLLGTYSGLNDYGPSLGSLLTAAGRHAVGLAAMAGLLPAVLLVTLTMLRGAWADEHVGPMLAVFWAATVVLLAQVAWYMAGGDRTWHIERYVMYLVPLGLTIAVAGVARVRVGWQPVVVVTLALSVLMLLAAPMRNVSEEEGVFGVFRPLHGLLGASAPVSLALATLLVGLAAAAILRWGAGEGGGAAVAALAGLMLGVFVVQDAAAWTWRIDAVREVRADRPRDLRWVDRAAGGPIGRIVVANATLGTQLTEFFNRDVTKVYVPAPEIGAVGGPIIRGRTCPWRVGADGRMAFGRACGPVPGRFLLDDDTAKLTFAGQRLVTNEPQGGRVVDTGAGPPRLLSLVFLPCGPRQFRVVIGDDGVPRKAGRVAACTGEIRGNLWLDRPGRLQLRFRGGEADQRIAAGGRVTVIPAGGTATVDVAAPGRPTAFSFQQDWTGTGPQFPTLESFDLVRGSERVDLMGVARD